MWIDRKLDPLHVWDCKDFQGQISKTPYVVRPTVTLTFEHPWPWNRIVKVKFSKSYISATGRPLDIERKGYESDTMLDPSCQLQLWSQLWLDSEYLDFHGKSSNFVQWMDRLIPFHNHLWIQVGIIIRKRSNWNEIVDISACVTLTCDELQPPPQKKTKKKQKKKKQ